MRKCQKDPTCGIFLKRGLFKDIKNYIPIEVRGPSGPQLLVGGPSGHLDFVLRALRALRPCHPGGYPERDGAVRHGQAYYEVGKSLYSLHLKFTIERTIVGISCFIVSITCSVTRYSSVLTCGGCDLISISRVHPFKS